MYFVFVLFLYFYISIFCIVFARGASELSIPSKTKVRKLLVLAKLKSVCDYQTKHIFALQHKSNDFSSTNTNTNTITIINTNTHTNTNTNTEHIQIQIHIQI